MYLPGEQRKTKAGSHRDTRGKRGRSVHHGVTENTEYKEWERVGRKEKNGTPFKENGTPFKEMK
jgi:hypothetical protein